ncbi:C69 family dipeptidase [Pandoraea anhela]|nr:C69 family dipeptidase [Pandoraea anhela]
MALVLPREGLTCTTIIVGKGASIDGSIIVARNADAPSAKDWAADFVYHPPSKGGYVVQSRFQNTFSYRMPENLTGYSGLPQPGTGGLSFEEAGFNDYGVGISATETIFSNDRVLKVDPYRKRDGVVEEVIPSILLPQAKSAREGVILLGQLIDRYGSGEGFGIAFVDKDEAWYFENAGGHRWVAVRVPDDAYFVSANQSRIGVIDVADTANVIASRDLVDFAQRNGLFDPQQDKAFNFRKVFGRDNDFDRVYNYPRIVEVQSSFSPDRDNRHREVNDFDDFIKPANKLSVTDVARALSGYYAGTAQDPYTSRNPSATVRPVSVYRAYQSHILQVRPALPMPLAHVQYIDFGISALGIYVPFYWGAKVPESYRQSSVEIDDASALWKFRKVQLLAMQNFPKYQPVVRAAYDKYASDVSARRLAMEKQYLAIYETSPTQAQQLLDQFSLDTANGAVHVAESLQRRIMSDMSNEIDAKYRFHGP